MTSDKSPAGCQSLAEIRAQIDQLDQAMVELLARRGSYVLAAARFKRSEAEVTAPQRVEQVIARVRALAQAQGTSADVVERVYRELIAAFTDAERAHWRQQ
ncbi:MAG: chorismate mutase [Comamonadaceae bacterium]|jgi:isochorismate pyruvate lyase